MGQGDTVYLRSEGDKHTGRNPLLVTQVAEGGKKVTAHPILHSNPGCRPAPNISSREVVIDEKYLYVPPHRRSRIPRNSSDDAWWRKGDPTPATSLRSSLDTDWQPNRPPSGEEDDDVYFVENVQEPMGTMMNEGGAQVQQEMEPGDEGEEGLEGDNVEELEVEEQDPDHELGEQGEPEAAPEPAPPDPNLPPQAILFPPWPPEPRRRLGATSATPKRGRPQKGGPDIVGRAVTEGEAIKYLLPENQGGERRGGVMSATVLHMAKSEQRKWPRWYNVRTQDRVDISIELNVTKTWWVFRSGRWYPGDHPRMPPPDALQEGAEEQGELHH